MLENYDKIIEIYEKNIIEKIETVGKPGFVYYCAMIKNERWFCTLPFTSCRDQEWTLVLYTTFPIVPWSRMNDDSVHYLSHRTMIKNVRDTTKTRTVFNASSKIQNNPSLNDCLQSSPRLLPLIFNILLRFRIGGMGLVAHTKQMFLNIEIGEGHRDFGW